MYVGCGDGLHRPRSVEAWRALGYRDDGRVTLCLCATAAPGTADVVDCLPDASRFKLGVLPTSSG